MRALIMGADNFEDAELLGPCYRLREAGFQVDVAAGAPGAIRGKHGYDVAVVVVDGRLVTSRQPQDLPAFMRELMRLLAR